MWGINQKGKGGDAAWGGWYTERGVLQAAQMAAHVLPRIHVHMRALSSGKWSEPRKRSHSPTVTARDNEYPTHLYTQRSTLLDQGPLYAFWCPQHTTISTSTEAIRVCANVPSLFYAVSITFNCPLLALMTYTSPVVAGIIISRTTDFRLWLVISLYFIYFR